MSYGRQTTFNMADFISTMLVLVTGNFIAQAIVPDVPSYTKALEISWYQLVAVLLYVYNTRS